jgi:hypothetical protein
VTGGLRRPAGVLFALTLAAVVPAIAQSKKVPKGGAQSEPAARTAPPKVQVAVESVLDRRTTRDFPRSELSITFKLEGEDAGAVQSARAHLKKAADDTGRSLLQSEAESRQGSDRWEEAREGSPPTPKVDLASPSRKAKNLSVEGVLETYLPSRDPAGTVRIERVIAKKDKPLTAPALASRGIRIQVLSRAGLEKEKKQAETKKKAQAAKTKGKKGAATGLEEMAGAVGDMLTSMFERLFMTAGDNDLILKVDDPGKKIFSFDLAASDGAPIRSYGTMEVETYRIVRMLEPIPPTASLRVRLKTTKSFGEVPFALTSVKLP